MVGNEILPEGSGESGLLRQVTPGFVYNITTGEMTVVDWPGKPLFETDHGRMMQIHLWSPTRNQWVKLVPEKFDEPGVLVVTPDELFNRTFADT